VLVAGGAGGVLVAGIVAVVLPRQLAKAASTGHTP
jgi:hypothetical protein